VSLVPVINLETVRSLTHLFAKEFGWTPKESGALEWHTAVHLMKDIEADYKRQEAQMKAAQSGGSIPNPSSFRRGRH
jgi:hypothetical protein